MVEIRRTAAYAAWIDGLHDRRAAVRIEARINRMRLGNPGDVKPVGEDVSEMRIDHGPGYRVYFVHHAHNGSHGLQAKRALKIKAYELNREVEALKAERGEWERRIALLRSDQIDRDLLEERARTLLGRVHANDLVIITGP